MSKLEINELIFSRYGSQSIVDSIDPTSYHYIITEGQNSELMYLSALLKKKILFLNNIKIVPLQKTGKIASTSDPYSLKEFAIEFRNLKTENNEIQKDDSFYVMFDRDSFKNWKNPKQDYLNYLASLERADLYYLVCSPCIEFWLLLHRDNVYKKSQEKTYFDLMFFNKYNKKTKKTFAQKKCIEVLGFDPKEKMDESIVESIVEAIKQSESFSCEPKEFGDNLGTNLGTYFKSFIIKEP